MTEVVLLGTATGDGWPNAFCVCASCQTLRARAEVRAPTSALVDDVLLLDCGPETARAATRAGRRLDRVHTVLLTHEHPDHCDPAFLLWRAWIGTAEPLLVAGPRAALERCSEWIGPDDPVELREVVPGDRVTVGDHDVRVVAAAHVEGSVLYDVTAPDGARLLYATDTGPLPEPTIVACADARYDLVLLEETFGDELGVGRGHHDLETFTADVTRLRDVGAITTTTSVVAIHLSHRNPPEPELSRRLAAVGAVAHPDLTVLEVGAGLGARVRGDASPRRVLITGGARSGKSAFAESLVGDAEPVLYVATAPHYPGDEEWARRVRAHRERRPATWTTVETAEPLELVDLLGKAADEDVLLVDCLTLWLTSVVDAHDAWDDRSRRPGVERDVRALRDAWSSTRARVVLVTNELGSGVVPATASGRYLRDLLGALNAELSADADAAYLVVAGRAFALPPSGRTTRESP